MNKKIISYVVVGIIVLVGVFYGGMSYGKIKVPALNANGFGNNMQNRTGQFGMNIRNGRGGGFVAGEIISKDDKSITVQIMNNDPTLANGNQSGSKIIFLGADTTVTKTVSGVLGDLVNGTQVSIIGTTNPDGSITAKSIQIRPKMK
jgi:hypothetical protein